MSGRHSGAILGKRMVRESGQEAEQAGKEGWKAVVGLGRMIAPNAAVLYSKDLDGELQQRIPRTKPGS